MSEQDYIGSEELSGGVREADTTPSYELDPFRPPLDVLVAMRPFGHKTTRMATPDGRGKDVDMVDVYVIVVNDDGSYADCGMRDLSWRFVVRELDKATLEAPWIVGTITKKRSYFLVPPTAQEMKRATTAVTALIDDRRAAEEEDDDGSSIGGADEEPF